MKKKHDRPGVKALIVNKNRIMMIEEILANPDTFLRAKGMKEAVENLQIE